MRSRLDQAICAVAVITLPIRAPANEASPALLRAEECMLVVLNETPEVSDAKLGIDDHNYDEGLRPYLQFRAPESPTWTYTAKFYLQPRHNPIQGPFEFMATLSGLGAPRYLATGIVGQQWKTRCGVKSYILFP